LTPNDENSGNEDGSNEQGENGGSFIGINDSKYDDLISNMFFQLFAI